MSQHFAVRWLALLLSSAAVIGVAPAVAQSLVPNLTASSRGALVPADIVPGEVIVSYRQGGPVANARASVLGSVDATLKEVLLLPRTEVIRVEPGQEAAVAAALALNPSVLFAEPNGIMHATAVPNDPRLAHLYGLHNTGQAISGVVGTADADIDAPEAWNMGLGLANTVRVAVIDTGVARHHPDLTLNMFVNPGESGGGKETNGTDDDLNGRIDDWRGWDFVNNDNNPDDDNNHGTHVAGTIAGRANNAFGVAGVASFARAAGQWEGPRIVAIKVLNSAGNGSFANIANGMIYAGTIGAKVANLSLGGAGTSATLDAAIASKPNTLYVIAAGNDAANNDTVPTTPCVPAALPDLPNKICVAATDNKDLLAGFSNYGAVHVDLGAPGVQILSTLPQNRLLSEDFSTAIAGRWTNADAGQVGAPRWERTNLWSNSAGFSVTDSPGGTLAAPTQYVDNQDNWLRNVNAVNLTGQTACTAGGMAKLVNSSGDYFRLESALAPAGPWTMRAGPYTGIQSGSFSGSLSTHAGQPAVYIRLHFNSNASGTNDGTYIDDLFLRCFSATLNATAFDFFNGTSMATPHVAGAAAFLFTKFPTASVAVIKDKILRSVDLKASLAGKTVTGGRLNLYKAAAESVAMVVGNQLRIVSYPGVTNNYVVSRFNDAGVWRYVITDNYSTNPALPQSGSRFIVGAGCIRIHDAAVKCPMVGINQIVIMASDMNDSINAATVTVPLLIDAGAGDDTLIGGTAGDTLIGGAGRDRFAGGTGNDIISTRDNEVDLLFNCGENPGDTDRVFADLAPNDPIVAAANNCEIVQKL